jgi:ParB/RepB/Spo0J family partition protein
VRLPRTITLGDVSFNCPYAEILPELSEEEYQRLKSSIKENGVLSPVLVDDSYRVLDGHHRLLAAKELGISPQDVPVEVLAGVDEATGAAIALAVNSARRKVDDEVLRQAVVRLHEQGSSVRKIASVLGIPKSTIHRWIQAEEADDEVEARILDLRAQGKDAYSIAEELKLPINEVLRVLRGKTVVLARLSQVSHLYDALSEGVVTRKKVTTADEVMRIRGYRKAVAEGITAALERVTSDLKVSSQEGISRYPQFDLALVDATLLAEPVRFADWAFDLLSESGQLFVEVDQDEMFNFQPWRRDMALVWVVARVWKKRRRQFRCGEMSINSAWRPVLWFCRADPGPQVPPVTGVLDVGGFGGGQVWPLSVLSAVCPPGGRVLVVPHNPEMGSAIQLAGWEYVGVSTESQEA